VQIRGCITHVGNRIITNTTVSSSWWRWQKMLSLPYFWNYDHKSKWSTLHLETSEIQIQAVFEISIWPVGCKGSCVTILD